ncbi:MAG TPA: hypothetical protein VFS94_09380 [Gemmatimonadales bacterium]|nr:hypothetical protein [Gemmatimonadales bacterium]
MRRFVLLAAAVAFAAACSDSSSPSSAESPAFQIGTGPSCSRNDLRSAAADVFGNGSAEVGLARDVSDNVNTEVANAIGFDLLAELAAMRDAESWSATMAPAGAALAVQLIACMNVETSGDISAAAFEAALAADGGFAVRGGAADPAGDVLSADGSSGVHAPLPWATWMGGRALFYGYPVATFATEISGGNAFDWSTVRAIADGNTVPAAFVGPAVVALCADAAPIGATQAQLRVQHLAKDDGGVILPIASGAFLDCSGLALSPVDATTMGGRLMHALLELVRPEPLFASTVAFTGIGGLKGSFSPFEVVYGGQIVLTFVDQPANGDVNTPLIGTVGGGELSVKVTGAEKTPWEGIDVHIDAVTNNGKGVTACGNDATTDEQGVAHFPDLTVSKAGGYFLVATTVEATSDPDVAAYSTATVNSDRFTLKNSTVAAPCS